MNLRLATLILLTTVAGLLQHTAFLTVGGVKPNLTLAILAAVAIAGATLPEFIILTLLAAVILKYSAAAFIATALLLFLLRRYLPWAGYLNNWFLLVAGTIAFYLFSAPRFLFSSWPVVLTELFYNLAVGTVVLLLMPKETHA